nr:phage capsid protein [uncultured Flavobacterium sp.]
MALERELWIDDIQPNLFQGIEFATYSKDHSSYIYNKTVHIPQAGSIPNVVKSRTVLPAPIGSRTDTELTYQILDYSTDPIVVSDLETMQISYDKRQEIMGEHISKLKDRIGRQVAFDWAVSGASDAARIIRTTGAAGTTLAPGATGTRKKLTKQDLSNLKLVFDRDLVPQDERYILMDHGMYLELLELDAFTSSFFVGQVVLPNAVINKLYGFNILTYSFPIIYDNAATPVKKTLIDNTGFPVAAATDNLACIAWSKYSVSRALGPIDVFMNPRLAEYYGDLMSALVFFGSTILRSDKKGVGAIVQAP